MNLIKRTLVYILLFLTINKLYADETIKYDYDSLQHYEIDEVVIHSFKQNKQIYLEPVSVSLLTAKDISQNNIQTMKDFSAFIPNFYMPEYGSKMTSPVYIRGIGSRINAPSVALYVDGVPYFDRAAFDINVNDIASIEVLRGPQGTIYGRNTMGGVINIYTPSPLKYQGTNISLGAGNYNYYSVGASVYNKIANNVGVAISTNYQHKGGYFTNEFTGKKADPSDNFYSRARLSWAINPFWTLDLNLSYEYTNQDGYPYRVYDTTDNTVGAVDYNEKSFYRRNLSSNGLHISYINNHIKFGSQTSFQYLYGKQGLDQDFTNKDLFYTNFYHRQQMISQEFNVKSIKENQKYQWQIGVFGFHDNYNQENNVDYRILSRAEMRHVKNPTYGYALYHQSTLNDVLLKNLAIGVGFRYDWEKTTSKNIHSSYNYGSDIKYDPIAEGKDIFKQFTPKFTIDYKLINDGLIYAAITKGYKTGGFNATAVADKDKTFKPEYSWNYEIGSRINLLSNKLHLGLSLFLIDWKDQQISQHQATGGGYILRNAGKSRSKGLEFSSTIFPIERVSFDIAYGYTQATFSNYKDGNASNPKVYDGNYLPLVPKHTLVIGGNYNLKINQSWVDDITFNINYKGLGKIYMDDQNLVNQKYYSQLDAKINLKKSNFSLALWAKNITNKKYISYYFKVGAPINQHYVQQGIPFTCGLDFNIKF